MRNAALVVSEVFRDLLIHLYYHSGSSFVNYDSVDSGVVGCVGLVVFVDASYYLNNMQ